VALPGNDIFWEREDAASERARTNVDMNVDPLKALRAE
jgi:hypothetical protein